jgi:PleD family two-component response regulator
MEQPELAIGKVRPLRPLRVLVAARDARFARVSGFLLARRGFDVETLRVPGRVLDTLARADFDVLILDASESFSEAARLVGTLDALYPYLTVLVVADPAPDDDGSVFRVFPKWTSLETLVLNLESLHLGLSTA